MRNCSLPHAGKGICKPMSKLVIVESPSKAKSIGKYLGKGYKVVACMGHVRDLPKSSLGVDVENGFTPKYITIRGKAQLVNDLKKQAKASDAVYLAADPDREGEAISWHLATILGLDESAADRVTFNEITKSGVKQGISQPRTINLNLVDAQQARRVLDRIVGYNLSPFLWKKVRPGLSAGRVQSVAVKIIVDRENEINRFVQEEYWTIDVSLVTSEKERFVARLFGNEAGKLELHNEEEAGAVAKALKSSQYSVADVRLGRKTKNPAPPFTTSTLQQEASRKLGFGSNKTMSVAQTLYEGVDTKAMGTVGLITYMRTDSLRISQEAALAARNLISQRYGTKYLPDSVRVFKSRSTAQDAHEAIRPADPLLAPETVRGDLTNDQYKLYKLIWDRFIACQMKAAVLDTISVDISAGKYILKASGQSVKFNGFTVLYEEGKDEKQEEGQKLPPMEKGDPLNMEKVDPQQHFTQPPPRFTEATLIKALEENGIGRPSTYAPTISTIIQRGYVSKKNKSFCPTPLGVATNTIMTDHFSDVINVSFTAKMEDDLDRIAAGDRRWVDTMSDFYAVFSKTLETAEHDMGDTHVKVEDEVTDILCEKCGRNMVIKNGRFGKFLACPGYPECKNTRRLGETKPPELSDRLCEVCGRPMVIKNGRYGSFLACSGYPECKNVVSLAKEVPQACPKCGGDLQQRFTKRHRSFFGCKNYPKCDFVTWDEPMEEKCPRCGKTLFSKKTKAGVKVTCLQPTCGYSRTDSVPEEKHSDE